MARTSKEKTIDRLLTLYFVNECYKTHNLGSLSETKLQKLVFLSEKELIDRRIRALNYRFVKLLFPTFSLELRTDLKNFVKSRFLRGPWFERTNKLKMILEDFSDVFRRNRSSINVIDEVLSTYANIRTTRLTNMVHRMRWTKRKTIGDLAMGAPLLYPLKYERARQIFKITDDELEDLEICLNPKISKELDQAFDEVRRRKMLRHEEVFRKL